MCLVFKTCRLFYLSECQNGQIVMGKILMSYAMSYKYQQWCYLEYKVDKHIRTLLQSSTVFHLFYKGIITEQETICCVDAN